MNERENEYLFKISKILDRERSDAIRYLIKQALSQNIEREVENSETEKISVNLKKKSPLR